jgi:hypothetical protein
MYLNNYVFWDIRPRSPFKADWRFRGTCHLYLQGRRISQDRKLHEAGSKHSVDDFIIIIIIIIIRKLIDFIFSIGWKPKLS